MIRFFDFIGNAWWVMALTVMTLLFLAFVSGVIIKTLRDSPMSLGMIILFYFIVFAVWTVILLVVLPSVVEYLISIY